MAKIIDGNRLAEEVKDKVAEEIYNLQGPRPNLAIIMIGERPDSKLYVSLKEREAKKVGIDTHLYKCDENILEQEVFDMIKCLNEDDLIDAILVQLPLPKGFDTDGIIRAIDPAKDADFFHPDNLEVIFKSCAHQHVMSPVFKSVLKMLESIDCELEEKQALILANSRIFGRSLARILECRGANCEIAAASDENLLEKLLKAEVLVTAVGKPKFITGDMIEEDTVVIDIGITKQNKKVCGDADFDSVEKKASYISPVPGGVGPMTIAYLFENCLELYKKRRKK